MNKLLIILAVSAAMTGSNVALTGTDKTGILGLHPKEKVVPMLLSARAEGGSWNKPATEKAVTLLHFSDLHGSVANLGRIVEFYDAYSAYIEDAIHTGDAVSCYIDDPNPWAKVKGAGKIINVIGNHDCWKGHKTWAETDIPYDATAEDAYKVFISPFVREWNVVQPDGVKKKGSEQYCACYFYKDYRESKVRLIALDCIHYDAAQDKWFAEVLQDAASKGYTVIGAQHYFSQTGLESIESGFSTKAGIGECSDPDRPQIECTREQAFITLDRFIDNGGKFVCWMSGHDHEDYIGYVRGHGRQLQILIDKAGDKDIYMHEDRTPGTINQDSFNLVTVNPSKNLLTIQRIGCTRGPEMQSKTIFSYNYLNREIIVNE